MSRTMTDHESEQVALILQSVVKQVERMERDFYSTNSLNPGLALRLDRIEGQIARAFAIVKWIGGGGLVGLVATVVLLWRIAELLPGAVK